jgi:hypothetical protein
LPRRPVVFSWGNTSGKSLVIVDETGKEIFRRAVINQAAVTLEPESMKLRPGSLYRWYVDGAGDGAFKLLNREKAAQVETGLAAVAADAVSARKNILIQQAAYLQLLSDMYPEQFDLYWLSYRLIQEMKDKTKEDQDTAKYLEQRFVRHLNDQLREKLNASK